MMIMSRSSRDGERASVMFRVGLVTLGLGDDVLGEQSAPTECEDVLGLTLMNVGEQSATHPG